MGGFLGQRHREGKVQAVFWGGVAGTKEQGGRPEPGQGPQMANQEAETLSQGQRGVSADPSGCSMELLHRGAGLELGGLRGAVTGTQAGARAQGAQWGRGGEVDLKDPQR